MKRSKRINLDRMRKGARFAIKPLAASIAAAILVGCGNSQEAEVFTSLEDCKVSNPEMAAECEKAYQSAMAESAKSGPKYTSSSSCEAEFGRYNCVPYNRGGNSWFMPALAGFMFARAFDNNDRYYSTPVYTSYHRHSPFYGQWTGPSGGTYGSVSRRKMSVSKDAFKPKPAVTKTMSRGGFGSKVAAKSRWSGGGKSRSSWGG